MEIKREKIVITDHGRVLG